MRLTEQVAGGGWFRRSHAPSQGSQGRGPLAKWKVEGVEEGRGRVLPTRPSLGCTRASCFQHTRSLGIGIGIGEASFAMTDDSKWKRLTCKT